MRDVPIPADPAKRFTQSITITLGDDIQNDHAPVPKPFQAGLPGSWKDKSGSPRTIAWVSNFEVKRKDGQAIPSTDKRTFAVTIPQVVGEVVYFAGGQVRSFDPPATGSGGAVTINLPLGVGDPPVGISH